MPYESVDALQKALAGSVFGYATDQKKAAGRALGTLVEIVTFYTLCAWNLRSHVVIERRVPEFGNPDIAHNVEFSLHPILVSLTSLSLPLTPAKLRKAHPPPLKGRKLKSAQLLSSDLVKRNACVLADEGDRIIVANLDTFDTTGSEVTISELLPSPFAIFECKRVGVEEGLKKGPQTIEKAKQGAYVARTVSSLQRLRLRSGEYQGFLESPDGSYRTGPYATLLREVIDTYEPTELEGFILTVGVASNHGNWFTSANPNKELRVLAQSYDWLLFLTDAGLSQFIDQLLLNPAAELAHAREAFLESYKGKPGGNRFTKVRVDSKGDEALKRYFAEHQPEIATWFNVISPQDRSLTDLQGDLGKLAAKNW